MKDDFDPEDVLRRYEADPSAKVKRTVLDRFGKEHAERTRRPGFWKRPVPLYAAAAALVIVMGFSYTAGERRARAEGHPHVTGDTLQTGHTSKTGDVEWVSAENDLL
jgi:hypothetical protein